MDKFDTASTLEPNAGINLMHLGTTSFVVLLSVLAYILDIENSYRPLVTIGLFGVGGGMALFHAYHFVLELAHIMSEGLTNYRIFIYAFHIIYGSFIALSSIDKPKSSARFAISGVAIVGFFVHIALFLYKKGYFN